MTDKEKIKKLMQAAVFVVERSKVAQQIGDMGPELHRLEDVVDEICDAEDNEDT